MRRINFPSLTVNPVIQELNNPFVTANDIMAKIREAKKWDCRIPDDSHRMIYLSYITEKRQFYEDRQEAIIKHDAIGSAGLVLTLFSALLLTDKYLMINAFGLGFALVGPTFIYCGVSANENQKRIDELIKTKKYLYE